MKKEKNRKKSQLPRHFSKFQSDPRELKPRFSNSSVKTGSKKVVPRIFSIRFLIFSIHFKKMSQQRTTFDTLTGNRGCKNDGLPVMTQNIFSILCYKLKHHIDNDVVFLKPAAGAKNCIFNTQTMIFTFWNALFSTPKIGLQVPIFF